MPTGIFPTVPRHREILLLFHATGDSPTVPCNGRFSYCSMLVGDSILPLLHANGRFFQCSTPSGDSPTVPWQREIFPTVPCNGRFSYCSMPTGDSVPCQREILLMFHTGDSSTVLFHTNGRFSYCSMPTGDSPTVPCQREILLLYCSMPVGDSILPLTVPCQREIGFCHCSISMPTGDYPKMQTEDYPTIRKRVSLYYNL